MNRVDFIKSLRNIADFLENNPDFLVPKRKLTINFLSNDESTISAHAKAFGTCKKFNGINEIGLYKSFGPITLKVKWPHHIACVSVPVPGEVVTYYSPQNYEKHSYPKRKWVCPTSFLKACCEE